MATRTINGLHHRSIVVSTSGNTYNVGQDAMIIASGNTDAGDAVGAIYERHNTSPPVGHNTFNIDGRLVGYQKGIETFGSNDRINIGVHGEISGAYAVFVHGNETAVTNRGNIVSASLFGIFYDDCSDVRVDNFGSIKAAFGIIGGNTDGTVIINEAGGRIYGASTGVGFESAEGMADTFINHGVVRVADGQTAYSGYRQNDTVINDGVLKGTVMFGDGQDVIDTRGGVISGSIVGGNGDDTLVTDNADYKLMEDLDGGRDTVKSTVSYTLSENAEVLRLLGKADIDGMGNNGADSLVGNAGNNKLVDGSGADTLSGGKGNDILTGGADDDVFHFATGGGRDTITDLMQTHDRADLSAWLGVNSFAEVMSHAHDQDDGVLIRFGHDSLLISGLSKAELTSSDFIFVT